MAGALLNLVLSYGASDAAYMMRHQDQQWRSMDSGSSLFFDEHQHEDGRTNMSRLVITRNGDRCIPRSILIHNPRNFRLKSIQFLIGGVKVMSFDSHFFETNTSLKRTTNQTIRYEFPEGFGLDRLLTLIGLQYHEVVLEVKYTGLCDRMKLFRSYVFMGSEERRAIANGL